MKSYISIISARDNYSDMYDISEWKTLAFRDNILKYVTWANQIISIGDDNYEYNALLSLRKYINSEKLLKNIRLVKNPSFETLTDQIDVITKSLYDVFDHKYHLDLNFK